MVGFSNGIKGSVVSRRLLRPHVGGTGVVTIRSVGSSNASGRAVGNGRFTSVVRDIDRLSSMVISVNTSGIRRFVGGVGFFASDRCSFSCFVIPAVGGPGRLASALSAVGRLRSLSVRPGGVGVMFGVISVSSGVRHLFSDLVGRSSSVTGFGAGTVVCRGRLFAHLGSRRGDVTSLVGSSASCGTLVRSASSHVRHHRLVSFISVVVRHSHSLLGPFSCRRWVELVYSLVQAFFRGGVPILPRVSRCGFRLALILFFNLVIGVRSGFT